MSSQFFYKHKTDILTAIITFVVVTAITTFSLLLISNSKSDQKPPADTVIIGNIYTGIDGAKLSESAVISGGKFTYVGTEQEARKYIGENTKVLEYPDGMVMAGMSDTHTHITMDFQTAKDQIDLSASSTIDEYTQTIKDFISAHPDSEMYLGMGWEYELFPNESPTKDILDQISTTKPIYIKSADAHSAWVNSAMLAKMGITKDTPDPIGGEIKRDANGNPSGMIKESAIGIYAKPLMPVYSVEEYKDFILKSQAYYASLGYTAYVEMFTDTDEANTHLYQAYEELDKEGKLTLRTQGAWTISNNSEAMQNVEKAINLKNESQGGMFELTDLKFFMDGVVESGGAHLSKPYNDSENYYGLERWPGDDSFNTLVNCIVEGNKNGMVAHFHAMGDAAVTRALDAIESARKQYIPTVHNVITHLEIIKDSDFPRFAQLDVIASANLSWGGKLSEERYEGVEVKKLGEDRASNAYPYKKIIDAGGTISYATDYPPGSIALPFSGFSVGISRSILSLPGTIRNPDLAITREEALQALTKNGAIQMRQDIYRGTIEVGKQADFVIIDTNLLTSLASKSALTVNLATFVDGQEIFHYTE